MIDAYVYKITNTITNEFYYGYRYKNQSMGLTPESDLWVKYFTSSNRIKNDLKQYGQNSFTASIIYRNPDSVKCWQHEQRLIQEHWGDPKLLNGKYHDPNSDVEIYRRVNLLSEESKRKMSDSAKGRVKSAEHKRKIALANTGNVGSVQKREKLSAARKGKPPSNKGVTPPKYSCPHCGRIVSQGNLNRWHGDNCKVIDPAGHALRTEQIAAVNKNS